MDVLWGDYVDGDGRDGAGASKNMGEGVPSSTAAAELYPIIVEMSREHPYTVTMDHCLASAAARGLSFNVDF